MRIKTEIGQIAIILNDEQYVFTPTLRSMGDIAQPDKVIDMLVLLGTSGYKNVPISQIKSFVRLTTKQLWYAATTVLENCCDKDTSKLWGYYIGKKYIPGAVPIKNIITLGRSLIESGIVGKPVKTKNQEREEVTEWFADDYIAIAMSQLNMTKSDAEQLTLIQLQRALELLHPTKEEDKVPTITKSEEAEMERAMAMFERAKGVK